MSISCVRYALPAERIQRHAIQSRAQSFIFVFLAAALLGMLNYVSAVVGVALSEPLLAVALPKFRPASAFILSRRMRHGIQDDKLVLSGRSSDKNLRLEILAVQQKMEIAVEEVPSTDAESKDVKAVSMGSDTSTRQAPAAMLPDACPVPFIQDPLYPGGTANSESCQAGCCLPCPQHYALYPVDALHAGFRVTTLLRVVSASATFLLLLSYLLLPRKREHPALLILFSAVSILLFSSSGFFALANPKAVQCANRYTESTQQNNLTCAIQGSLLVFGSHSTATWLAVLIVNLHLHTVWSSNALRHRYLFIHLLCWGVPLILTAITLAQGAIKYEFGEMCLVDHDRANALFFYPLAAIVFPAFLVHIWTVVYIARISVQANRSQQRRLVTSSLAATPLPSPPSPSTPAFQRFTSVGRGSRRSSLHTMLVAIRVQWRALVLALALVLAVIFFWLLYFAHVAQLRKVAENPAMLSDWSDCFLAGGDQTTCAGKIANAVPDPSLMIAAEAFTSCMGIVFFCIFALQRQFFDDWKELFRGVQRSRKRARSVANPNKRISVDDQEENMNLSDRPQMSARRSVEKVKRFRREALRQLEHESTLASTVADEETNQDAKDATYQHPSLGVSTVSPRVTFERLRTRTRLGMADVALPTSPVELGVVYIARQRNTDVQFYF